MATLFEPPNWLTFVNCQTSKNTSYADVYSNGENVDIFMIY